MVDKMFKFFEPIQSELLEDLSLGKSAATKMD